MKTLVLVVLFPMLFIFCGSDSKKEISLLNPTTENEIEIENSFAVVQLFTSQGCSSCPSADKLLEKVEKEYASQNVVVLSYHVDYWNRLGWKDPYSKSEYTQLQYNYASQFGESGVYTPQAVINGALHFVGSSEAKMSSNLSKFLKIPAENSIELSNLKRNGTSVAFDYDLTGTVVSKKITVALVINNRKTVIGRGENGGRTLSNSNIVVQELTFDAGVTSGKKSISIPAIVSASDTLTLVAFVQDSKLAITGASQKTI